MFIWALRQLLDSGVLKYFCAYFLLLLDVCPECSAVLLVVSIALETLYAQRYPKKHVGTISAAMSVVMMQVFYFYIGMHVDFCLCYNVSRKPMSQTR
jgi:hypothetical protein